MDHGPPPGELSNFFTPARGNRKVINRRDNNSDLILIIFLFAFIPVTRLLLLIPFSTVCIVVPSLTGFVSTHGRALSCCSFTLPSYRWGFGVISRFLLYSGRYICRHFAANWERLTRLKNQNKKLVTLTAMLTFQQIIEENSIDISCLWMQKKSNLLCLHVEKQLFFHGRQEKGNLELINC